VSEDIGQRVIAALGEPAARELLEVLERSDADRAALIGRLHVRDDAAWLAELLIDLETRWGRSPGSGWWMICVGPSGLSSPHVPSLRAMEPTAGSLAASG
jgi:hypothetical protein